MQPHGAVVEAVVAPTAILVAEMAVVAAVRRLPRLLFPLEMFLPIPLVQPVERVELVEEQEEMVEPLP